MSVIIRFVNLVLLTKLDESRIWKMVGRAKSKINVNTPCGDNGIYPEKIQTSSVHEVEIRLQLSKKDKDKLDEALYDVMTYSKLKTASEMFFYLLSCSETMKPWIFFYTDLFQNQSPQKIVLTLNRIMKGKITHQNKNLKDIAEKIFKEVTSTMSLKYTEYTQIDMDDDDENATISKHTGRQ